MIRAVTMGQVEEVDTKQAEVESLRREASKLCHVILCLAPVSFRLLQTVPAPTVQTVSNCFKVLQTASKCFKECSEGHHFARPGTRCCKLPAMAAWHPLSRRCARRVFYSCASCGCLV